MPAVLNVPITEVVATDEPTDLEGVIVSPDRLASLVAGRPTRLQARTTAWAGKRSRPPHPAARTRIRFAHDLRVRR
jgi:hypothetical protein